MAVIPKFLAQHPQVVRRKMISATFEMRSGMPTEVPPNLCTIMAASYPVQGLVQVGD